GVAPDPAPPDPGRAGRRLHRARRALRELRAPADHSLDAALGGGGRHPGAPARRTRPRHHRAHRDRPADRAREEERHHDDRLRARHAAPRRQAAGRGHLPGVPAPVPPDYDDHHGGPARRSAPGSRYRDPRPASPPPRAALAGGLPPALGTGTGAELRRPLGITIVGGLIVSQVLTLYTTPVVYLYLERVRSVLSRRRGGVLSTRSAEARG